MTDAIIAGEGEGPLAPTPRPLGLLTLGASPAAVEWVHAGLMGFDPRRIPIVAHAFDRFRFPLAPCAPEDVVIRGGGATAHLRRRVPRLRQALHAAERLARPLRARRRIRA